MDKEEKEFENYVDRTNKNIANRLKDSEEELAFYIYLVKRFNEICDEKVNLEQQVKKQQEVIDRAIEYIEKTKERRYLLLQEIAVLDILKGDNNE